MSAPRDDDEPFRSEIHRLKAIWDRLAGAAQAAVKAAADADARALGITDREIFTGAVNELAAVLDDRRAPRSTPWNAFGRRGAPRRRPRRHRAHRGTIVVAADVAVGTAWIGVHLVPVVAKAPLVETTHRSRVGAARRGLGRNAWRAPFTNR
ncbi:hypothetical protein GCM10022221_22260 [Actinocorallia aurea]